MNTTHSYLDKIIQGDSLELIKKLPDGCIDLVLTDPPYGIAKESWDVIDNYQEWWLAVVKECERVLKPTGVLYFFQSDMHKMAQMITNMEQQTKFKLNSFCVWDKGISFRRHAYTISNDNAKHVLHQWFNTCEYIAEFWKCNANNKTKQEMFFDPEGLKKIKEKFWEETRQLGLSLQDVKDKYKEVTGKSGFMFRHYFQDSQFGIPTQEVWEKVFMPLGYRWNKHNTAGYEALRQDYEALRPYHKQDNDHRNVLNINCVPSQNRLHSCQKPINLLQRLISTSSRQGEIVLDPFIGSGSTAIAAIKGKRHFVGFEQDPKYFKIAQQRIFTETKQLTLF